MTSMDRKAHMVLGIFILLCGGSLSALMFSLFAPTQFTDSYYSYNYDNVTTDVYTEYLTSDAISAHATSGTGTKEDPYVLLNKNYPAPASQTAMCIINIPSDVYTVFRQCRFDGGAATEYRVIVRDANVLFDQCQFISSGTSVHHNILAISTLATQPRNITITNCDLNSMYTGVLFRDYAESHAAFTINESSITINRANGVGVKMIDTYNTTVIQNTFNMVAQGRGMEIIGCEEGLVYNNNFICGTSILKSAIYMSDSTNIHTYDPMGSVPYKGNVYSNYLMYQYPLSTNGVTYNNPYPFDPYPNIYYDAYPVISTAYLDVSLFTVTHPLDVWYYDGDRSLYDITWVPAASSTYGVTNYNVTINDELVYNHANIRWFSDTPITVNISYLPLGTYDLKLRLSNGITEITDEVTVSVIAYEDLNDAPQFLNPMPDDEVYLDVLPRPPIVWAFTDETPADGTFNVTKNGELLPQFANVPWALASFITNGIYNVEVALDPLPAGTYYFVITIDDGHGKTSNDSVFITKKPTEATNIPPQFVGQLPIYQMINLTSIKPCILRWDVLDTTINDPSYRLTLNDVEIATGSWSNLEFLHTITFDYDETYRAVGDAHFNLTVFDGLGGSISDDVYVTVTDSSDNIVPVMLTASPYTFSFYHTEPGYALTWLLRDFSTDNPYYNLQYRVGTGSYLPVQPDTIWYSNIRAETPLNGAYWRSVAGDQQITFASTFYDGLGKTVSNTSYAHILLNINPVFTIFYPTHPSFNFFDSEASCNILWKIQDQTTRNPTFNITRKIGGGAETLLPQYTKSAWSHDQTLNITLDFSGIAPDTTNIRYSLYATDGVYGTDLYDYVTTHYLHNLPPVITNAYDFTGEVILDSEARPIPLLTVTDATMRDGGYYVIEDNGVIVENGLPWASGDTITHILVNPTAGDHTLKIWLYDGVGNVQSYEFTYTARTFRPYPPFNPFDPSSWAWWYYVVVALGSAATIYAFFKMRQQTQKDVEAYLIKHKEDFPDLMP